LFYPPDVNPSGGARGLCSSFFNFLIFYLFIFYPPDVNPSGGARGFCSSGTTLLCRRQRGWGAAEFPLGVRISGVARVVGVRALQLRRGRSLFMSFFFGVGGRRARSLTFKGQIIRLWAFRFFFFIALSNFQGADYSFLGFSFFFFFSLRSLTFKGQIIRL